MKYQIVKSYQSLLIVVLLQLFLRHKATISILQLLIVHFFFHYQGLAADIKHRKLMIAHHF